jgi:hypothetical protein
MLTQHNIKKNPIGNTAETMLDFGNIHRQTPSIPNIPTSSQKDTNKFSSMVIIGRVMVFKISHDAPIFTSRITTVIAIEIAASSSVLLTSIFRTERVVANMASKDPSFISVRYIVLTAT